MNTKFKKKLRAIGHTLSPVVTIAGNGLSDAVLSEINRALDDHELIKLKILGDKAERLGIIAKLRDIDETEIIQVVGGVALVYRQSRTANPKLSNVARADVL